MFKKLFGGMNRPNKWKVIDQAERDNAQITHLTEQNKAIELQLHGATVEERDLLERQKLLNDTELNFLKNTEVTAEEAAAELKRLKELRGDQ